MDFNELKQGVVIENKRSKIKYQITKRINEEVFEMRNLKYFGNDYINKNTIDEYTLITNSK